jgi:hypothetical protein
VSNVVGLRRDGDVAVITVDNPPVNALKHAVRVGLSDALVQARDDTATRCRGRTFRRELIGKRTEGYPDSVSGFVCLMA